MSAKEELAKHLAGLWPVSTGDRREAEAIISALSAAGYVVAPREPSIEMLQNGRDAYRATQLGGLSGMTIEAQIRAQCRREAACWNAMLSAAQEPQP